MNGGHSSKPHVLGLQPPKLGTEKTRGRERKGLLPGAALSSCRCGPSLKVQQTSWASWSHCQLACGRPQRDSDAKTGLDQRSAGVSGQGPDSGYPRPWATRPCADGLPAAVAGQQPAKTCGGTGVARAVRLWMRNYLLLYFIFLC